MKQAHITVEDRKVVDAALKRAEETNGPAAAMELPNGQIITGKTSCLLGASSALLLNALKNLAGLNDELHLISPSVIEPIQKLKTEYLGSINPRLHTDEILIALSICAATDDNAKLALEQIPKLSGCQPHKQGSQDALAEYSKLGTSQILHIRRGFLSYVRDTTVKGKLPSYRFQDQVQ